MDTTHIWLLQGQLRRGQWLARSWTVPPLTSLQGGSDASRQVLLRVLGMQGCTCCTLSSSTVADACMHLRYMSTMLCKQLSTDQCAPLRTTTIWPETSLQSLSTSCFCSLSEKPGINIYVHAYNSLAPCKCTCVPPGRSFQLLRSTGGCRQGHRSSSNHATTASQSQPSAPRPAQSPNSVPPPPHTSSTKQENKQQPLCYTQGMCSSRRPQHSSGRRSVGRVVAAVAVWVAVLSCPLAYSL